MKYLAILIFNLCCVSGVLAQDKALIISGGSNIESNHSRYHRNTKAMFKGYMSRGIKRSNIYVHYADGKDIGEDTVYHDGDEDIYKNTNPNILGDKTGHKDINGPATKESIKKSISKLSSEMKEGETLSIFITDHGASDGDISLWGEHMSPEQLFTMLKPLLEKGISVNITGNHCYSGALHKIEHPNLCVLTNSDANTVTTSKVNHDLFADSLAHCLGVMKDYSLLDCYYYTLGEDHLNETGYSTEKKIINDYIKNRRNQGEEASGICYRNNILDPYLKDIRSEITAVASTTRVSTDYLGITQTLKSYQKQISDTERLKAQLESEYEYLKAEYDDLKPEEQEEKCEEYTQRFDELQARIDSLDKIDKSNIFITDYDFNLFIETASAKQLEKYFNAIKCLHYDF